MTLSLRCKNAAVEEGAMLRGYEWRDGWTSLFSGIVAPLRLGQVAPALSVPR
jgi:hypothetical protein